MMNTPQSVIVHPDANLSRRIKDIAPRCRTVAARTASILIVVYMDASGLRRSILIEPSQPLDSAPILSIRSLPLTVKPALRGLAHAPLCIDGRPQNAGSGFFSAGPGLQNRPWRSWRPWRLCHHYFRPSNSAPAPSAGPAVGSIVSGFLAISVWVVRIKPATDAALRTAL